MITSPLLPIPRSDAEVEDRSMIRTAEAGIRPVMVTSISFPLVTLVIRALVPIGRVGCEALNPPARISWVAIPRWVKLPCLIWARQRLVTKNNPSKNTATRRIYSPLLLIMAITTKKSTVFARFSCAFTYAKACYTVTGRWVLYF
jgi:hypothetical protein